MASLPEEYKTPLARFILRRIIADDPRTPWSFLYCREWHDDPVCENVQSYYGYRLDRAANIAFAVLFSVSLLGFLASLVAVRRTTLFDATLVVGTMLEVLGYVGRVCSLSSQWAETPFLMQVCCLAMAPAVVAAAMYLCLRRIVVAFGAENSRLKPEWYPRSFIPCDIMSLALQAVGGAMASAAAHDNKPPSIGINIMIAGLGFQSVTLAAFGLVSIDFTLCAWRRHRQLGSLAFDTSPDLVAMRASRRFRLFLAAILLATILVLWRSVFRVFELSGGWTGPIMADQGMFIAFEGVLVLVACFALNIAHPAWCAAPLFYRIKPPSETDSPSDKHEANTCQASTCQAAAAAAAWIGRRAIKTPGQAMQDTSLP